METRTLLLGAFLFAFALTALATWSMHQSHYKNRSYQLLAGRVEALEKIATGDHTF